MVARASAGASAGAAGAQGAGWRSPNARRHSCLPIRHSPLTGGRPIGPGTSKRPRAHHDATACCGSQLGRPEAIGRTSRVYSAVGCLGNTGGVLQAAPNKNTSPPWRSTTTAEAACCKLATAGTLVPHMASRPRRQGLLLLVAALLLGQAAAQGQGDFLVLKLCVKKRNSGHPCPCASTAAAAAAPSGTPGRRAPLSAPLSPFHPSAAPGRRSTAEAPTGPTRGRPSSAAAQSPCELLCAAWCMSSMRRAAPPHHALTDGASTRVDSLPEPSLTAFLPSRSPLHTAAPSASIGCTPSQRGASLFLDATAPRLKAPRSRKGCRLSWPACGTATQIPTTTRSSGPRCGARTTRAGSAPGCRRPTGCGWRSSCARSTAPTCVGWGSACARAWMYRVRMQTRCQREGQPGRAV